MKYLPEMNITISTYNKRDVENISSKVPSSDRLEVLSQGYGVAKVHEISFSTSDDLSIKWKKLSSDTKFTSATIKIKGTQYEL